MMHLYKWNVEVHDGHTSIESKYYTVCPDVTNEDAELIAAAPDMLRALKNIISSAPITGLSLALEKDIQSAIQIVKRVEGK